MGSASGNFDLEFYINNVKFLQLLTSGDLNIVANTNGYKIFQQYVLRNNGNPNNIFVGVNAGNTNTTDKNTFVGFNTGINTGNTAGLTNGFSNTYVGFEAGKNTNEGYQNAFLGESAGYSNTSGYHNTFIGMNAGHSNTIGKSNVFIGTDAGYSSVSTDYNVMVGRNVGYYNVGAWNCFYGKDAGMFNTNGTGNCFFGHHSGANDLNTAPGLSSDDNAFFGFTSGHNFYNGTFNVMLGSRAGLNFANGNNNIFIGGLAQRWATSATMNNSVSIGYEATALSDNMFVLGNNNQNVGIGLSNDTWPLAYGPRSKLEINSDPVYTSYTGTGAFGTGLQFRQVTSTTPLTASNYIAPYGRVLTVDADGIVKLTDGGTFGYGLCPTPTFLPINIGMYLNDFSIYYEGQGYSGKDNVMIDAIGLGYSCDVDLPGKLSVDQTYTSASVDFATTAGYFHNGDITSNSPGYDFAKRSIYSICDGYSMNNEDWGISNVAGDFVATNSEYLNIAVRGRTGIHGPVRTYGQYGFGGYFQAIKSSVQDIGVCAISDGNGSNSNYGIYASAPIGFCTTGSCSDAAGYFNGDVYTTSSAYFTSSDINLKDNIQPIQNSTAIVTALSPKTFSYRTSQFPYLNLAAGVHGGLIAQEVQTILPQLVKSFKVPARIDSTGMLDTTGTNTPFLAVNYLGIIPYLIGAVKEQQQSIDSLRSQLQDAVALINNCCGSGQRNSGHSGDEQGNNEEENSKSTINVELSDANTIILDQNSPNPFSEETVITYVIPKEVSKAIIMIYDNSGQVLKTITINERGHGSLHIYAEKLSSGIYSYTLIADGKKVDSKQMVCQK